MAEFVVDFYSKHDGVRCEQVVRCRDCEHYSEHEWVIATDVSDVCHFWHGEPTKVEPDGFCAWGERRVDA